MGPLGMRSFRAMFAGSIIAVILGVLTGALGAQVSKLVDLSNPGWVAFAAGLLGVLLLTPAVTASLMGVDNHHRMTGYAFALACGCILLMLGFLYMPLIPFTPTVVAGASVAGIRYSEWNA